MAFTYDDTLATARDRLRFALGDTVEAEALLQDATYEAALTRHGQDEAKAQSDLAAGLVARYSREPDRVRRDDGTEVSWKERLTAWRAMLPTPPSTRLSLGMQTRRAERPDSTTGGEYYAGARCPWETY